MVVVAISIVITFALGHCAGRMGMSLPIFLGGIFAALVPGVLLFFDIFPTTRGLLDPDVVFAWRDPDAARVSGFFRAYIWSVFAIFSALLAYGAGAIQGLKVMRAKVSICTA